MLTFFYFFSILSDININFSNPLSNNNFIIVKNTNLFPLYLRLQILKCHFDLDNIWVIDFSKDAFIMM